LSDVVGVHHCIAYRAVFVTLMIVSSLLTLFSTVPDDVLEPLVFGAAMVVARCPDERYIAPLVNAEMWRGYGTGTGTGAGTGAGTATEAGTDTGTGTGTDSQHVAVSAVFHMCPAAVAADPRYVAW
jgi:hypothetical protein